MAESESVGARPVCFVLMPFGTKHDVGDVPVDFDSLYEQVIGPAAVAAGLNPIRADEALVDGITHTPTFEWLVLSEYAVVDVTLANVNVYYALGYRHAVRPDSTVLMYAEQARLPFDRDPVRALSYDATLGEQERRGARESLSDALIAARPSTESPVLQLVEGPAAPEIDRLKTDVFRDRAAYSTEVKERLAAARRSPQPAAAIHGVEVQLGPLEDVEAGVQVDLLLSYRSCGDWARMIALVQDMPEPIARSVLVREQYAFALNRAGRGHDAARILEDLIEERGPSSETLGILGRVHKDRWQAARDAGETIRARGALARAIDTYLRGFEADWRDAYPGVNAVILMHLADPPDERRHELLPVVTYSVRRRIASGDPDYWDHATLLELAVLARDREGAVAALADAAAANREPWEAESTLNNIREIARVREERGEHPDWVRDLLEAELERLATRHDPDPAPRRCT